MFRSHDVCVALARLRLTSLELELAAHVDIKSVAASSQPEQNDLLLGRYHGGRRPSSDDSPAVIPPSALDKPSIVKRYHRWRACSHTSPRRSPAMVTLHDTGFVECRWWNDGWSVKTVVT